MLLKLDLDVQQTQLWVHFVEQKLTLVAALGVNKFVRVNVLYLVSLCCAPLLQASALRENMRHRWKWLPVTCNVAVFVASIKVSIEQTPGTAYQALSFPPP